MCTTRLNTKNCTFCPQSVFMCFVWIWEQTAIISLYSINWPVFITETECVYCAVRTGSLYIILRSAHTVYLCVLCGSENKQRLFPYTALTDWVYNRDGVCLLRGTDWVFIYNSMFCPHSVFMCCVWIWEQTAIISLYSINWLVNEKISPFPISTSNTMDTTNFLYTGLFTQFLSNLPINKDLIRETENYWLVTLRSYPCHDSGFPIHKTYVFTNSILKPCIRYEWSMHLPTKIM